MGTSGVVRWVGFACLLMVTSFGLIGSARAEPGEIRASIVNVLPQGNKSILILNRGSKVGARVGQIARCAGPPAFNCKLLEVYELRSKCLVELDSKDLNVFAACRIWPSPHIPEHPLPARGVLEPATPIEIKRVEGKGLVAAGPCVGFIPNERSAYILSPGPVALSPHPDERGLDLLRIDFATGGSTTVQTFGPARLSEARRQLADLVSREALLACHMAEPVLRSTDEDRGLMAHHRLDRILFWSSEGLVYAAMEGGAGLAERVGTGEPESLWFVPGNPHHLSRAGERWQVLEVR